MHYSDVHKVFYLIFKFTGTGVWALSHIVNLYFSLNFLYSHIYLREKIVCYDVREPPTPNCEIRGPWVRG